MKVSNTIRILIHIEDWLNLNYLVGHVRVSTNVLTERTFMSFIRAANAAIEDKLRARVTIQSMWIRQPHARDMWDSLMRPVSGPVNRRHLEIVEFIQSAWDKLFPSKSIETFEHSLEGQTLPDLRFPGNQESSSTSSSPPVYAMNQTVLNKWY
jgi:hypothetical protein